MKANLSFLSLAALFLASLGGAAAPVPTDNWPQFRGPGGRGLAASNATLPDHWSASSNVAWKAEIPGRGWSSPIVWGSRVFVTTAVGASPSEPAKAGVYMGSLPHTNHEWKVICLDLSSGKTQWERVVHHGTPVQPAHSKNSYASETPVTDGERVYVYVPDAGVFCLDLDGHPVWSKTLDSHKMRYGWGTAASPTLYGDRLYIVNDNEEQSYLLALDKTTGKEVWRVSRDEKSNWSTPFVWENEQRTEIVTAGTGATRSYDLQGHLLWWFKGMSGITIATPYAGQHLLYVSSGFAMEASKPLYAIRPGASGDISLAPGQTNNASIAWCQPTAAPYNATTLLYDDLVYVLLDRGELAAFDAQTGAPAYQHAVLPQGLHFTASPWAANGLIFCLNEDGVTFVTRAGKHFELLQTNKLAEDDICLASPALAGDRLLIRTAVRLYCIRNGN
jgi:outer membrane protein assembly factor BamB